MRATRDLIPASAIPLAYFALAHAGLFTAALTLAIRPDLPGGFHYHPRVIALVHLVTLAWVTGSILGAFYIVAPLALRMSLAARRPDWMAFAAFAIGVTGMVTHFWADSYGGMAWSALMVSGTILWVGGRACSGLIAAPAPAGVKLHVVLAFGNALAAASLGILVGFDRSRGFLPVLPMTMAYAHAHLAAIG